MLGTRALTLFFLLVGAFAPASATAKTGLDAALIDACSVSQTFDLPTGPTSSRILTLGTDGWLEIEEAGQQLAIGVDSNTETVSISQPLRHGYYWARGDTGTSITIFRADKNDAPAAFVARLHCLPADGQKRHVAWLKSLQKIDKEVFAPHSLAQLSGVLDSIDTAERLAETPVERALIKHYRAMAHGAANMAAEARADFISAETAWRELKDTPRAEAARLGWIEEARSLSDYPAVLQATFDLGKAPKAPDYFVVRMENSRCLVLASLNDFDSSSACSKWVLAQLQRLKESAEYASALQGLAGLELYRGHLVDARQMSLGGIELASGPVAGMTKGRFHLVIAEAELRLGNVASSLSHASQAEREFEHSGAAALRWRANAYLAQARIHAQIGDYAEAYDALSRMLQLFPKNGDPGRLAVALSTFANLEAAGGSRETAILSLRGAESIYQSLGMHAVRDGARVTRLGLQLQDGDNAEIEKALMEDHTADPVSVPAWRLLAGKFSLVRADYSGVQSALKDLHNSPLSLQDQIGLNRLEAEYLDRSGDPEGAQRTLLDAASGIDRLSRQTNSPVLRYVIARQVEPLRRTALQLMLDYSQPTSTRVESAWSWAARSASSTDSETIGAQIEKDAEQFDRTVAAELLSPASSQAKPGSDSAAQRELLSLMVQPGEATGAGKSVPMAISLMSIQQRLDADSSLIAYLDGDTRGGLLWVTHDDARLLNAAAPEDVRTSIAALREALRSPNSSMAEIQSDAQTLSTQLLHEVPNSAAPKHLFVLADEMTPRIAWSVLTWPRQTEPLLDTTTVELVRLDNADTPGTLNDAAPLHVIVASQQVEGDTKLASLATASAEPQLIQTALSSAATQGQRPVLIADGAAATRETVLSALDEPGAWVHIAAHGTAQPQRIGYAGLWLEPSGADKSPAFLSWLDILDKGVRSDLVVLNACQLGDSGNAINGNLSFAAAVSRAGARQVVAALWPVSDSAAALWVPTFYSTLAGDPDHNAAAALRAAQLRLRASRAFTHPFFWAGMQATSRLSLPAPTSLPALIATKTQGAKLH